MGSRSPPTAALDIADSADNAVRRVSARGKISAVAGTGAECSAPIACGNGGAARSAQLNYPEAVALDPSGSLYIADTYDAELRWVSAAATASFTAPSGKGRADRVLGERHLKGRHGPIRPERVRGGDAVGRVGPSLGVAPARPEARGSVYSPGTGS